MENDKTKKKFDGALVLALSASLCLISIAVSVPVFVKIKSRNDGSIARDTKRAAVALEKLAGIPEAAPQIVER